MKTNNSRRIFLKNTLTASTLAFVPFSMNAFAAGRKFTLELNPGAIGVKIDQQQLLDKAAEYGFESIVAFSGTLADWSDSQIKDFNARMKAKKIVWGTAGLPMDFRRDEETQKKGIAELPRHAAALQKAGVTRMSTWIMPTDANLTYMQNMKQHGVRLKEAAKVLADYNIVLGLEYVGPKTLMARDKYSFVHTLAECRELIAEVNAPNVGLQLDSFHWFCAGETVADLKTLTNKEIVTVDLNDARTGVTAGEQLDGKRELPMATGVIDMKSFLEALVAIGYDGPMRAEPFNLVLNDMEDDAAIKATADAMKKAAGLLL